MPAPTVTDIPAETLEKWNEQLAACESRDRGEYACDQCDGEGNDEEDGSPCGDCGGSGVMSPQSFTGLPPAHFLHRAAAETDDLLWSLCDTFAGVAVRGLPASSELAARLARWREELAPAVFALAADLEDLASAVDAVAPTWPPPAPLTGFYLIEKEGGGDATLSVTVENGTAIDGHLAAFHALRQLHSFSSTFWRWVDDLYPKAGQALAKPEDAGRWLVFTNNGGVWTSEATREEAIQWTWANLPGPRGVIIFQLDTRERLARFIATCFRHLRSILGDRLPKPGSGFWSEPGTTTERIVASLLEHEGSDEERINEAAPAAGKRSSSS